MFQVDYFQGDKCDKNDKKTKAKNLSERIDYMENQINTSTTNKI